MKRFEKILMKDIGWKLLSVAIAMAMWFMVINITQPVDTRTYYKTITLENQEVLTERGLTVGNAEELTGTKVTIKVKAQRTALDRLSQSTDWLKATVDLSSLEYTIAGDTVTLPVDVSLVGGSTGYTIVSKSPTVVEVKVEKYISKEVAVTILLNGEVAEDVQLSAPSLSPERVLVSGPSPAVAEVTAVRGMVNALDVEENGTITAKLVAYNREGLPVKGVSLDTDAVIVSYQVYATKTVPVQISLIGTPMAGYEVGNTGCNPSQVEVMGTEEALAGIHFINLDSIDVTERTTTLTETYSLQEYLPENVFLKETRSIAVTVEIKASDLDTMTIILPQDQVIIMNEESGKEYSLHGSAQFVISGEREALKEISQTGDGLSATVDVSQLEVGEHQMPATLSLPAGISGGHGVVTVIIKEAEGQSAPLQE